MKNNLFKVGALFAFSLFCSVAGAQQTGHWALLKTANKAAARSECGLAALNGKLYLVGGDGPAANVEVFDPAANTWAKMAQAPVPLHHFQAVALGDKV